MDTKQLIDKDWLEITSNKDKQLNFTSNCSQKKLEQTLRTSNKNFGSKLTFIKKKLKLKKFIFLNATLKTNSLEKDLF